MSRVLVIGDVHEPACHPAYRAFCSDLRSAWKTDKTVFIGDIIDNGNISFWKKHVDLEGVNRELDQAFEKVSEWYKDFPKAQVMIGNHDERIYKVAASVNIPSRFVKEYAKVWNTPRWKWKMETVIDGVNYMHGHKGKGGKTPALDTARDNMISTVLGHFHKKGGVHWLLGTVHRIFGLDVGCGIDTNHPAYSYDTNLVNRPVISAAVVIDGLPYHEIMPMSRGEAYHRSRF